MQSRSVATRRQQRSLSENVIAKPQGLPQLSWVVGLFFLLCNEFTLRCIISKQAFVSGYEALEIPEPPKEEEEKPKEEETKEGETSKEGLFDLHSEFAAVDNTCDLYDLTLAVVNFQYSRFFFWTVIYRYHTLLGFSV